MDRGREREGQGYSLYYIAYYDFVMFFEKRCRGMYDSECKRSSYNKSYCGQ